MKFNISQTQLQNALGVVSKGVSTRSTLPVLSGVLITAYQDEIILQTTNLELSIQYAANALVEEEGSAVFPAKLLLDIVKSLNDAAICIESQDGQALISCDSSRFTIKTLNAQDFPNFPHVDIVQSITIPFGDFSDMVKRVAKMVSKDESRAILTGVLINVEDGVLSMVSTDSFRLSVTRKQLPESTAQFNAVVSGPFLSDIAALQKTDDDVVLSLAENQIMVKYQSTVFVNRRIEGTFPNYKQLLPSSYSSRVSVDAAQFHAAVRRTSVLGNVSSPVKISVNPLEQTIELSATSQDVGSVKETLPCSGEGEAMEIAFNCAYVMDGLSVIGADKVHIELQSSMKPGILTSGNGDDFLYLIMPVRV